jgi:hypothetical protein
VSETVVKGPHIDVRVIDIQPHPDQATNNPGCWAVHFEVVCDGSKRTFWRWHRAYTMKEGQRIIADDKPKISAIIQRFWDDTFAELHGFSFDKDEPWPCRRSRRGRIFSPHLDYGTSRSSESCAVSSTR